MSIRIAIIEDELILRENICYEIEEEEGMDIVFSCDSVEGFIAHLDATPSFVPDIVLLDIGLPGMSGLEGLPIIRKRIPDSDVMMFTSFETQETILKALCNGAVGYISKKTEAGEVIEGIRIVQKGGSSMSPQIAREIVQHLVGATEVKKPSILSSRQLEIIERLAEGRTYSQIGEEIFVSTETVRSHIKKMYKTLEVNNKAEAIAKYLRGEID